MFNYYDLDAIPVILKNFKVDNIIMSGMSNEQIINKIITYCDENNAYFRGIDFKYGDDKSINKSALEVLGDFNDYAAIFLNDDPNWYTVFSELNLIKEKNIEFPLVFICNNTFPHKYRDSYANPNIIPDEYRHRYSKNLIYNDISIDDGFFHATEENTPKNGVSVAIEDFLIVNKSIGMMNFKLANGIIILYPKNSISQIRLGKINDELDNHILEYDSLSDTLIENNILVDYISNFKLSYDDVTNMQEKIDEQDKIIMDYENKIEIKDNELSYNNTQVMSANSKLSLTVAQIKNLESKLFNSNVEVNHLKNELNNANGEVNHLKNELNNANGEVNHLKNELNNANGEVNHLKNELNNANGEVNHLQNEITKNNQNIINKETELNSKIENANVQLNTLKNNIAQKEKKESELNILLQIANNQIKDKNADIQFKKEQLEIRNYELMQNETELNTVKKQYIAQLSKLDNKEYCISCFKEEISNNSIEIQYLKNESLLKKILSPFAYIYLIFKSNPKEFSLNIKLYKSIKNSKCFDIGYYLNNNNDVADSKWCKYFSPELHYVCNGFDERRKFNKKYFNRNSKKELLDYILNCDY